MHRLLIEIERRVTRLELCVPPTHDGLVIEVRATGHGTPPAHDHRDYYTAPDGTRTLVVPLVPVAIQAAPQRERERWHRRVVKEHIRRQRAGT